ncbi:restriction endonuclease subunit S [Faecousia sp. CLA-AA-H192]|uniref:Restriction endonuclease subunit S n=1 Tax=Faecousia intestinalis TaxID=3133167 RepID=A0ABV1G8E4_9FIRM
MREMRDSGIEWVGQIPKGWELRRAKTLFTQSNSKGNKIEVLLSPTQKYGVVPQSQLEGVVQVKEDTDLQMFKTIHKGDFVISLRSFQGGFEYSLYEGVCSPAYQVFYPTSPICDTYYRYLFKSQSFISKMNNLTVGIREGKNIQYIDFANSQIPVPPIAEQERIAAFLDAECAKIDAVLEKTRASIEEYKKLKQAVITQAVTKGIRGDRPMKDSGIEWIGDIPAEWRKTQLRHCAAIKSGITLGKKYEKTDSLVERPYLRVANVQDGYVDLSVLTTIKVTQDEDLKYRLHAGDVLMTEGGDRDKLGRGCVWHGEIEPCLHQNHIFAVQTSKDTLLPEFLEYLTVSDVGRSYFDVTAIKTTNLACTSSSKVLAFTIPLPSVEEQAEIVEALNTKCAGIDALIAKKQQYLTEIENYKKSLIYEYVTGKKEVKISVLAD